MELPPTIQPEGGRHQSIHHRLEMMKKIAIGLNLEISDKFKDNIHFWFLVSTSYYDLRTLLRKKFKKLNHKISIPHQRETAMEAAISHAKDLYELQKLQATDALTGLWARGALDNRIKLLQKWERQAEEVVIEPDSIIVMLFLDVDDFKKFNDTYDHTIGDKMLRKLAEEMKRFSRDKEDFVARYGGEEFVILRVMDRKKMKESYLKSKDLPLDSDTHIPFEIIIEQQVEKFRQSVSEGLVILNGEINLNTTVSMSVIKVDSRQKSLEAIYKQASDILHRAKDGGKNCTFSRKGKIALDSS